jgi:hypothetical protein
MFPMVISTVEEARAVFAKIQNITSWMYPVWSDPQAHPAVNTLSVLFVIPFFYGPEPVQCLGFNHNELPSLPPSLLSELTLNDGGTIFTPSLRELMYVFPQISPDRIIDGDAITYTETRKVKSRSEYYPDPILEYHRLYRKIRNINRAIPLMQWLKYVENEGVFLPRYSVGSDPIQSLVIPVLQQIEKSGLQVNPFKFQKHFGTAAIHIVSEKVHTQYHPYTTTGRPSNAFGGVNYAALNKKDGSRECFISRFEGGKLLLFDFESFHLRLMADLIQFPQPQEPFHEYLGKQYLGVPQLTQEQYEQSKQRTFSYLYGETRPEPPIEFFEKVYNWIDKFWAESQFNGWFLTALGKPIWLNTIQDPSKAKIFSYYMQSLETLTALTQIQKLLREFESKRLKSVPILYTYDSLLVDYCPEDGEIQGFAALVKSILESTGLPVRVYGGDDYHNLVKF